MKKNQLKLPSGQIITFNEEQSEGITKIEDWIKSNTKKFFVLAGYAGTGKEQNVNCLVQTPQGPKKIGGLMVGDKIFGVDGEIINVDGIYPQGVKESYKITFSDGSTTESGEDHLWEVYTHKLKQRGESTITLPLKTIMSGGLTYRYGNIKRNYKYSIPLCQPVKYEKKELPIHPYLLGMLIGGGNLCGNSIAISIPDIDTETISLIEKYVPKDISINKNEYDGCPEYRLIGNEEYNVDSLKKEIVDLGLDIKSINNFIPNIYKYGSVEQRYELLRGLMDTNGTVRDNGVSFSTSSKQLMYDVIELVQSLGGTTIRGLDDTRHENIYYNINVKILNNPFKAKRKADKWTISRKNLPSRYITSIENIGLVEQVCISVSADNGLYLTDNYIVTHNTTIIKKILDSYRGSTVVSAPTHKAKKVIMNATKVEGVTLHGLLGLRPDVALENFNPNNPQFNPIALPKINDYNLVIIDEASMINKELYDLIKHTSRFGRVNVLFMGDPAQIPPVGEKESIVFMENENHITHQLRKIERQNNDNPIVEYYDALRNNLNRLDGGFDRISKHNNNGEGILFTKNKSEFRKHIIEGFKNDEFKKDTDYCKVIAWKNETVMKSNKIIRYELIGDNNDVVELDDVLMGYRSISNKKRTNNVIENSADYVVIKKGELTENSYGIKGYEIKLRESLAWGVYNYQDVFIINTLDHDNLHKYADMHDFFRDIAKTNKKLWNKYYEFRRQNILMVTIDEYRNGQLRMNQDIINKDIDYGYAITGHKSQGSTYNTVFVMENDINDNWVLKERNQIKYVALTRPSKNAVVLINTN